MSKSLSWSIIPPEPKANYIDLKYEIGKYFDENYNGDGYSYIVGSEIIPFLRGIAYSGSEHQVSSANKLIEAIEKHGKVCLTNS